jgi:dTDP-4-dehydrorhamnose 3,5-epimerase-like enzyme
MPQPQFINGSAHKDERGSLKYNNAFDLSPIKRFYTIEPASIDFKRGWQGHKIEQRWFTVLKGSFEITIIEVDDWESPNRDLEQQIFTLAAAALDVLYIPAGFITCIQAKEENAILGVFADYQLGELNDEYRYELNHFSSAKISE